MQRVNLHPTHGKNIEVKPEQSIIIILMQKEKKDASKTGLRTDIENGVTYFLEENGEIFKNGQKVINGVTYVFGADGKCTSNYKPGWEKTADGWKWKAG